jgi:hypothetical protein
MAGDIRFKHPFTCIIGGSTGSRNPTFCIRFLQNLDTLFREPNFAGGIIWCNSEQSAVPRQQLKALRKNVQIHEGVPENLKTSRAYYVSLILTTC